MTAGLLQLLAVAALAAPALADDTRTLAGGIDTIDEALLGPNAPGGVRPDNLPQPKADSDKWQDRVALTLGIDFTNAYISRGLRQEDNGFICQPYASLSIAAVKTDDLTLNVNFSTWSSFHDRRANAATAGSFKQAWYEADYGVGTSVEFGNWTAGVTYTWLGSPAGSFADLDELAFAVAYDDSEALGAWSLKPAVAIICETSGGYSDGADHGVYAQFSITPGTDLKFSEDTTIRLDLPVTIGTSFHAYYQDAGGGDNFFGFASIGPKVGIPLPLPDGWGAWTLTGSATYIMMGDHARDFNGGDPTEWVFAAGISIAF